jgi:hypothetical protein
MRTRSKTLNKWKLSQILSSCVSIRRSLLICAICSLRLLTILLEKLKREERDSSSKRTSTPRDTGKREARNCCRKMITTEKVETSSSATVTL